MKKLVNYIIAFFLPAIIFFIASILGDFYPLGKNIFNIYDSLAQFPGMFMQLKDFSLLNFTGGLGFNFFGTAAYYLFSPFSLLIYFFDNLNFHIFYTLLIYIKISLASLFMYILLKSELKNNNMWAILFACAYSLCGFSGTYYYNTMWMDGIYLLPLIILGINRLISQQKCALYLISLALAIIFNYYIGYMICIFCVIYFIYKLIISDNLQKKKAIKNFLISSLLAGLIASAIIIPSYFALTQGKASGFGSDYTNYFGINEKIMYTFYNFTAGSYQLGDQSFGFAQIYSSMLAFVGAILFFFNKNFSKKEKIVVASIIFFYLLSFNLNILDFAWQFFQKPVWWQSRYSFTFSAFLILIGYKSFTNMEGLKINNKKRFIIIATTLSLIIISFILCYFKISFYKPLSIIFIIISLFIIVDYFLLSDIPKFKWIIVSLLIAELFINSYNNLKKNSSNNETKFYIQAKEFRGKAIDLIKELDNNFYRMDFVYKFSSNDGMLFNYNGITYFNSVRNQRYVDFAENYLNQNVVSNCGTYLDYFNPYFLSLLNTKYIIDYEMPYFEKVIDNFSYSAYKNPYPLSLGFMVSDNINNANLLAGEVEHNINNLFGKMTNTEIDSYKVFTKDFIADKDYLMIKDDDFEDNTYHKVNNEDAHLKGTFLHIKKGDSVKITKPTRLVDLEIYENTMEILSENLMHVNESNGHIEGIVKATEDKNLLLITIPYDKGITLKVDNKIVEPKIILDTFIGIELSPGEHNIEITYFPEGLRLGIGLSSIGIILSIIYLLKQKKISI